MRYLITGAGMVGSAVAARLRDDGHEVTILDIAGGDGVVRADLRDARSLAAPLRAVDGVFHTAAIHGMRPNPPRDFFEVNVAGTWNLYEAIIEAGVAKVVHASTVGVYAESSHYEIGPGTPAGAVRDVYGHTKWLSEQIGRHFATRCGLEWVALRYGGIAQTVELFEGAISPVWARSGALVDLRDVVEATVQAMLRLPLPRDAYVVAPAAGSQTSLYQIDSSATEADLGMRFEWTFDKLTEPAQ